MYNVHMKATAIALGVVGALSVAPVAQAGSLPMQSAALKKTVDSGVVAVRWRGGPGFGFAVGALAGAAIAGGPYYYGGYYPAYYGYPYAAPYAYAAPYPYWRHRPVYAVRRPYWHRHPAYWGGPGPYYGYGW